MTVTIYEIPDLLTLLFAANQYPNGFVAIGADSNAVFCTGSITQRPNMDALKRRIQTRSRGEQDERIILYPDADTFYAKQYDQTRRAPLHCLGCGLLLDAHLG